MPETVENASNSEETSSGVHGRDTVELLTPGNDFPEFSQSRTKLRQRLLTLPPRRPNHRSPTWTPAGDLRSGRRRGSGHSLESRAEHPSTENQEVISGPTLSFVRPDADFFPTPVGHPLSGARETWLAPNGLRNLSIRDSTAMARSPELARLFQQPDLENHWVPMRNRSLPSVMAFVAQATHPAGALLRDRQAAA